MSARCYCETPLSRGMAGITILIREPPISEESSGMMTVNLSEKYS